MRSEEAGSSGNEYSFTFHILSSVVIYKVSRESSVVFGQSSVPCVKRLAFSVMRIALNNHRPAYAFVMISELFHLG